MRSRYLARVLLAVMFILVTATPALANSLASWVWIWPGVVSIEPLFGLLPTVLVSFVERPFVSRAGMERRPLIASLRANLLSLLAGIPIAPFVLFVESDLGLVMLAVLSVTITVIVEIVYFRLALRGRAEPLRWGWIVAGNIASNLLLLGLAIVVRTLQEDFPQAAHVLLPYQDVLIVMRIAISLTAVTAAVAEPTMHAMRNAFSPEPQEKSRVAATGTPDRPSAPSGAVGNTVAEEAAGPLGR